MRKVIVSHRILNGIEWVTAVKGEAKFHQFGMDYEEFENGPGNYSTAIVEWPDGTVEMVRADRIKFLKELPSEIIHIGV